MSDRNRWLALYMLCAGELMIVLDTTVVNVALPSIQADLGFSEAALVWVVNAYMVTYGGLLLLGGRLGDLYGRRRLFLMGTTLFTAASLACGLANSQELLIAARAVQGVGGAVVSAIAMSLIMGLFSEPGERAKAMGIFGFVCAGGGSVGVLAGGLLTSALGWESVFLVNLPVGIAVYAFCMKLLPKDEAGVGGALDITGAVTVTAASMAAIYGIVNGDSLLVVAGAVLFAVFLAVQTRASHPLMPLRLFRVRSVSLANGVGVLWAAAMFAWFFLSALYMQHVLGYDPMQIGLAFLPANLIMAVFSIWLSAKLVMRFGLRLPIVGGMLLAAAGLALFAFAPVDGQFAVHVLPGMVLLGFGAGLAFNPVLLAAMSDAAPEDAGLASGLVNTSFMMGGALGLAVLASVAAARSAGLQAGGMEAIAALNAGYQVAFLLGAMFAAGAGVFGYLVIRARMPEAGAHDEVAVAMD